MVVSQSRSGDVKYAAKEANSKLKKEEMRNLLKDAQNDKKVSKDAKVSLKFLLQEKYWSENNHLEKSIKLRKRSKSI